MLRLENVVISAKYILYHDMVSGNVPIFLCIKVTKAKTGGKLGSRAT